MKRSELKQIVREGVQKALKEAQYTPRLNQTPAKKKGRFVPETVEFLKSDRDQFKEHFKLVKNKEGEYKLYISPLMKAALDGTTRGRTGTDFWKKTDPLVILVNEKLPGNVRSILKKFQDRINPGLDMYSINTKIKEVTPTGDISFYNPGNEGVADLAKDDTINEKKQVSVDDINKAYYEPEEKDAKEDEGTDDKPLGTPRPEEPKIDIKSVIEKVAGEVFAATNVEDAKRIFIDFIKGTKIKEEDKKKMEITASGFTNLVKLQFYVANALLKYEGMGTSQLHSKDKDKEKEADKTDK